MIIDSDNCLNINDTNDDLNVDNGDFKMAAPIFNNSSNTCIESIIFDCSDELSIYNIIDHLLKMRFFKRDQKYYFVKQCFTGAFGSDYGQGSLKINIHTSNIDTNNKKIYEYITRVNVTTIDDGEFTSFIKTQFTDVNQANEQTYDIAKKFQNMNTLPSMDRFVDMLKEFGDVDWYC